MASGLVPAGTCVFSGLCGVDIGDDPETAITDEFFLVRPNEFILSASECQEAASASTYLVYKPLPNSHVQTYDEVKDSFFDGLMALQVLKPVRSLGILFYGERTRSGRFSPLLTERRPPMEPGHWAIERSFDGALLRELPSAIQRLRQFMENRAENRNAVTLLQLGLEHFHPLIAGLLWVMGLEAILNNNDNKNFGKLDFERELCNRLGASTTALGGWKTVEEIAIPLYVLRNKLAHGVDIRRAASDAKYPIDLTEKHTPPGSDEQVPYAPLLSEAAGDLLCQVLRREIVP